MIRYMGCDRTEQRGQRRFMFGIVMDVRNAGIYSNRRDVNNSRNGSHTRDSPTGPQERNSSTRKKSNGRTDLDIRDDWNIRRRQPTAGMPGTNRDYTSTEIGDLKCRLSL
jgi:hypothetical protein